MRGFERLAALSVIFGALALGSSGAQAAASTWDHNGSLMRLEEKGSKRTFIYQEPRENLAGAGVKRGAVLFDGEVKKDGRIAGYAKLFRKGCDPVDYFVEGAHDKGKGEILLQGQAPIYSGDGCKITGYSDEGSASSLTFSLRDSPDQYAARADDGREPSDDGIDRRSYLPPSANEGGQSEDGGAYEEPRRKRNDGTAGDGDANGSPDRSYGRFEPDHGSRDYLPRDYADRRNRNGRRYDGYYYTDPINPDDSEEDDYYDYDEEDDDTAYSPYQPRWRRY
jgi:hypothetical protein